MNILQMSVQAGLLTAVVIAIRAAALYKLPRTSFLFLWGIVLLRMLIPFSVSAKWSFYNIFSGISIGAAGESVDLAGEMSGLWDDFAHIRPEVSGGLMEGSDVSPLALLWRRCTFDVSPLAVLWACGAAALAIFFGAMLIRSHRVLRDARPVETEPFIAGWLAAHRMLRPLEILRSARAASPLSMGVLRPCIILPEEADVSDERLRYILAHEYIHVRRFDMLWKLLALCGVCIHWFNPMAWVMLFLLNRDLELSCDEMVLRYTAGADRAEYAGSLLDMAEQNRSFFLIHNYFGKLIW
ncbi:MAG TPA: hypothetical protein DCZ91_08970 [Lachnospiraceae bacterium]|nr:hypothetical protein [Lachnospiraceae bacterium]